MLDQNISTRAAQEITWSEERFEAHLEEIRTRSQEFNDKRHISKDVIEAWQNMGLFRAFVPSRLGGSNMPADSFLRYIERISEADGSAGWVASFAFATKYLSALPVKTLEELYADTPDLVFAGALFPLQPVEKVEGGVRVSGRWKFGSGCLGASVIGVGVMVKDGDFGGLPLMAVLPAEQVRIEETWDTIGMAGTGSHDLVVEDQFVPDEYLMVRGAAPSIDDVGYRYPSLAMAAQVLAITGAGAARAAINHILNVADRSKSITGAPTLGDRENVQMQLAEAEAKLESARCWFYDRTREVWAATEANETISRTLNMQLRLSSSHLARTGADVARMCFEMAGTMGIFNANPLSRFLTDAMVVAQHAFLTQGTFMNAGKVMVGHDYIPGYDEAAAQS